MNTPHCYWIHGPKASGKTTLVSHIVKNRHVDGVATVHRDATYLGAELALLNAHTVIFEEFTETKKSRHFCEPTGDLALGDMLTSPNPEKPIKASLIIVVSEEEPRFLRSHFHIISIQRPPSGSFKVES